MKPSFPYLEELSGKPPIRTHRARLS